jgi:hypothetical protein
MFLLTTLFPFLLKFVGDNMLGKILDAHNQALASANEGEKNRLQASVNLAQFEFQRRQAQRDLQIKELENPFLWWPKFLVMLSVALYITARFAVKTWGLNDFHIAISELDNWEGGIAAMVLSYMFLGSHIDRALGK